MTKRAPRIDIEALFIPTLLLTTPLVTEIQFKIVKMTDCPEPEYGESNVSFDFYLNLLTSESDFYLIISKVNFSDSARCISQGNVSFDYYSLPYESNISNICPLPTPGQLERLITIR